jgi:dihydrofolate synthase/folylpolyglutamate synthase
VNLTEALADLDARGEGRMIPDLSRILALATYLSDPQLTYPTIHVTGTNGKGTAARVATAVACAHGIPTGLYTSPHLASVTERFSICDRDISEGGFADLYTYLLPYLQLVDGQNEDPVTYFEALTALAFLWFEDAPVGLGVFEVGMGGEWDATNLVAGDVAVITPISLDHPELGSTVPEVATEKAGIIKEGKIAVVREQPSEAAAVIAERAATQGASLLQEWEDWEVRERLLAVGGQSFAVRTPAMAYEDLYLPLFGEHAAGNAAAGIVAVEAFIGQALDAGSVRDALTSLTWPGRLEVVPGQPTIVLDGAHNPAAAQALAAALVESFVFERLHLVLGVSGNKDVAGVVGPLAALDPATARVVMATRARVQGEAGPVVRALEEAGVHAGEQPDMATALEDARAAASPADLIVVTGSLYTVADARRALDLT